MPKVLVIGKTSFLARRFLALSTRDDCVAVSHNDVDRPGLFDGVDVVVNFAFDPRMRSDPYASEHDFDNSLAERIPPATRLIMLSSRMVYGTEQARGASEEMEPVGLNLYGKNKLVTERRLRERLGGRVTILRLANVLGWEDTLGHPSFIALVLRRLRDDGRILYDVSPFVRRDFVTDRYLVAAIETACTSVTGGTFNVGSGVGLEVGRVAMWVLEGYGRGELTVTSPRDHDEFWLDMYRSEPVFGAVPTQAQLRQRCFELGKEIAT